MFNETFVDVNALSESRNPVTNEKAPASVGIPETAPVTELSERPGGSSAFVTAQE